VRRPRRIGLVGLGAVARYYLAAVEASADFELAAACDVSAGRLDALRGRAQCYTDHRIMLAEADLDVVVVTAPNDVHVPVARDALAAGLPVCVEKPLALRVEEAEELHRLARAGGTCLFTAFHRRYNGAISALTARLAGAARVQSLTVRYLERIEDHIFGDRWYLDPERCGGGCVADNGPNAFDLVRLLLGEVSVEDAEVARDADGVDRSASVRLRAENGALARVDLDWSYPGELKDVAVRLVDGGRLHADLLDGHPGFKESLWHEYVGVLDDFGRTLGAGADPGGDGIKSLTLVRDAYRAAAGRPAPDRTVAR
jgi:predicted dehydrogenase